MVGGFKITLRKGEAQCVCVGGGSGAAKSTGG